MYYFKKNVYFNLLLIKIAIGKPNTKMCLEGSSDGWVVKHGQTVYNSAIMPQRSSLMLPYPFSLI